MLWSEEEEEEEVDAWRIWDRWVEKRRARKGEDLLRVENESMMMITGKWRVWVSP